MAAWASPIRPTEIDFNLPSDKDCFEQGLIRKAQQVLQSALDNATQDVPAFEIGQSPRNERAEPLELMSPEFLAWMLQGKSSTYFPR